MEDVFTVQWVDVFELNGCEAYLALWLVTLSSIADDLVYPCLCLSLHLFYHCHGSVVLLLLFLLTLLSLESI